MELLESGLTLQDVLRREMGGVHAAGKGTGDVNNNGGPASDSIRWQWVSGVASGLRAMHEHGWIHNDVKPANILLAGGPCSGHVKLCDFGLAARTTTGNAGGTLADRGSVLPSDRSAGGTPTYMAPEKLELLATDSAAQDQGRNEDSSSSSSSSKLSLAASDVYSLGICTAEIHAGFGSYMERAKVLEALKREMAARDDGGGGDRSSASVSVMSDERAMKLVERMLAQRPGERPTAACVEGEAKSYAAMA